MPRRRGGVLVIAKATVGTAFAGRVSAMTGIDEDFHRGGKVCLSSVGLGGFRACFRM